MFTVRGSHGRALYSPLHVTSWRLFSSTTCRRAARDSSSSRYLDKTILQAHGPIAEQLAATGLWYSHGQKRRTKSPSTRKRSSATPAAPVGDKSRVNIVSDKLCDDVLSYAGKSFERHRGCDILDLYPGAGAWSKKLHEFLEPRSHVLLEPDAELYRPFLQPLLDQPGTTLVPKSGIVWRDLNSVLTPEFLPHQSAPDDLNARNDTLLVTANLAFHPKKRFLNFESVTSLVLHQFVNAVRTSGLFQRYGIVRMLIWTRTDDTLSFIPRNIQRRRRQALENDMVCEWLEEICGEEKVSGNWFVREDAINHASLVSTIQKMRKSKLSLPAGRIPEGFEEALAAVIAKAPVPVPGKEIPTFKRPYKDVLADLRAAETEQGGLEDSADLKKMTAYGWRANADRKKAERFLDHAQQFDKLMALCKSKRAKPEAVAAARNEWEMQMRELPNTFMDEFVTYRDNLHAFRHKPPLLQWDRRRFEPMTVQAEEFFPNIHCSLVDIQPKAPHPLLRQTGPGSNRAGDMFDLILASLMNSPIQPIGPSLDALWPGAADYILPRWKSLHDLAHGGFPPELRHGGGVPRLLNTRQMEELLELWMEWPFRPEFHELVGRTQDDPTDKHDDGAPDVLAEV